MMYVAHTEEHVKVYVYVFCLLLKSLTDFYKINTIFHSYESV